MSIPCLSADAPAADKSAALRDAGALVVTNAFEAATASAIRAELAESMAATRVIEQDDPEQFYPGRTRRVSALIARSPTATERLVAHPVSTQLSEEFLLPNGEYGYQLHVSAALEVGPGARKQELHREEDSFTFFPEPRPNLILASMWAVTDFRADNGATLIVPGSHRWDAARRAREDEVEAAEMPAGSVLYWLGGTLHGAGANVADDWRYGVILTYSVGWVRQEENQYLDVPARRVAELTPEVRRIVGFEPYRALGFSDPSIAGANRAAGQDL
ncbi:MAG: phytanoyl-CoA dioxygenase family protein [Pseudomonadota bacterium]